MAHNLHRAGTCYGGVAVAAIIVLLMQFTAFKLLPLPRQTDYLVQHGRFLAALHQDSFDLQLFACHDFYAEMWRVQGEEQVLFIHIFQNPDCLFHYLEKIILPGI
ncbi:hypothetical protein [Hymenobacter citatus]|nr:hypothetical protein [Hymenobacter citatus]